MLDELSGKAAAASSHTVRFDQEERQMDDVRTRLTENAQRSPFFTEEHEMLRDQVRRFVEEDIKPYGENWEQQGFVPREVLRRMG